MSADRWEDERWEYLPLDLDFDADSPEPDQRLQLPAGQRLVILRGGGVRVAVDLPDIAEYGKRTA